MELCSFADNLFTHPPSPSQFFTFFKHKDIMEFDPTVGRGTPSGRQQTLRPCLYPRWFMPPQRSLQSFPKPKRPESVRKRLLHRCTLWMHAQYELLPLSPLNDTSSRAVMPARLKPSLEGAPILEPSFDQSPRPANALRPFGTILPGSTLESLQLSTPPPRDSQGRPLLEEPNFVPLPLSQPLPLARKRTRCSLAEFTLEMNYARRYSNSAEMRSQQIKDLIRVTKDLKRAMTNGTLTPSIMERWESAIETADIERLHSMKIATHGGIRQRLRLEHSLIMEKILGALRSLIPKPEQGSSDGDEAATPEGTHRPTRRPLASLGNGADAAKVTSQPRRARRFSDTFVNFKSILLDVPVRPRYPSEPRWFRPSERRAMRAIESNQTSTLAGPSMSADSGVPSAGSSSIASTSQASVPNAPLPSNSPVPSVVECATAPPNPTRSPSPPASQCRRARAPYPGPSTRVLRSMSKQGISESGSTPAALAGASRRNRAGTAVAKTPSASHKPGNDMSKTKRTHTTRNKSSLSTVEQPKATQSRYNLRSRKRDLDEDEGKSQTGNTRLAKRRRT